MVNTSDGKNFLDKFADKLFGKNHTPEQFLLSSVLFWMMTVGGSLITVSLGALYFK